MSIQIHPTALIDPEATLGTDVTIGPFCVIGPQVVLGDRVVLKSHVVIDGETRVGDRTVIHPFASIGGNPQDLKYHGEKSRLEIGSDNTIREYVTMHPGTEGGNMVTRVGSFSLFMVGVHIAHDCVVGDHVVMANQATLAGHVTVGDHATIGGLSAVHQFVRIGSYAIIGGMSGVESDVIPFGRVKGERAFLAGLNLIGLERGGFDKEQIKTLQRAFNQLFGEEGTMDQRLETVACDFANDPLVSQILNFARAKTRFPLCQPPKKAA